MWRNGRRSGLKIRLRQLIESSSLSTGTNAFDPSGRDSGTLDGRGNNAAALAGLWGTPIGGWDRRNLIRQA